jgi:hypothetical protein
MGIRTNESELTFAKLAARHETTLERISCSFETFGRCLPRFYSYIRDYAVWNISGQLKTALVQYYAEVIGHCEDSVRFLQTGPISACQAFLYPLACRCPQAKMLIREHIFVLPACESV